MGETIVSCNTGDRRELLSHSPTSSRSKAGALVRVGLDWAGHTRPIQLAVQASAPTGVTPPGARPTVVAPLVLAGHYPKMLRSGWLHRPLRLPFAWRLCPFPYAAVLVRSSCKWKAYLPISQGLLGSPDLGFFRDELSFAQSEARMPGTPPLSNYLVLVSGESVLMLDMDSAFLQPTVAWFRTMLLSHLDRQGTPQ